MYRLVKNRTESADFPTPCKERRRIKKKKKKSKKEETVVFNHNITTLRSNDSYFHFG